MKRALNGQATDLPSAGRDAAVMQALCRQGITKVPYQMLDIGQEMLPSTALSRSGLCCCCRVHRASYLYLSGKTSKEAGK